MKNNKTQDMIKVILHGSIVSLNPMIKVILLVIVVVVATLEAFWLQSILEHFNVTVGLLVCLAIVVTVEALTPKALQGLLLLSLFVTQCYIWIF